MIKKNLFKTTLVLVSLMAALLVGGCGSDKKTANTENNTNATVEVAKNDNTTTSEVKESVNSNTEASIENKTEEASVEENKENKENTEENNNEVNNESNDTENYVENNDSNDGTYEENNDSWIDNGNNDEYTSEDNNTDVGNDTSNDNPTPSVPSEEEQKRISNRNYDWDSNESIPNPYPLNVFTTRAYYDDSSRPDENGVMHSYTQEYKGDFTVIYTLNETRDWVGFEKACNVAYEITKAQRPDLVSKCFTSMCIGNYKEGKIIASFLGDYNG